MNAISKAALIAAAISQPVEVPIAALGGATVLVKKLSAKQAADYAEAITRREGDGNDLKIIVSEAREKLILLACVDPETMMPMFDETAAIGALDNNVVKELFEACQKVNGLTKDALDNAKKD